MRFERRILCKLRFGKNSSITFPVGRHFVTDIIGKSNEFPLKNKDLR
jgi:hypothetical protein